MWDRLSSLRSSGGLESPTHTVGGPAKSLQLTNRPGKRLFAALHRSRPSAAYAVAPAQSDGGTAVSPAGMTGGIYRAIAIRASAGVTRAAVRAPSYTMKSSFVRTKALRRIAV